MVDKKSSAVKLIDFNSQLCTEWHPTKNRDLDLQTITKGSNKKVWWQCNKGHEWQATIGNRSNGKGCPYCSGFKVWAGFNDLMTTNPTLAKEWHPTKNGALTPIDVSKGSAKKAWWLCEQGHEWEAVISSRNHGSGCPYCANKKILVGFNDLETINPILAKEWHPTKNSTLKPNSVTISNGKKVWWRCKKGHEWQAVISSRTAGVGCPYCSNKKILKGFNDLKTINPTLAKEWHPTKNGSLLPSMVSYRSGKKVWWKCKEGHEWKALISNRQAGKDCPYCSGRNTIKGYNDLVTVKPHLIKEWHPTKNGTLKPEDVSVMSNKKVWWKCKRGHEWKTSIDKRSNGTNCPYCSSGKQTSFGQELIYFYIQQLFSDTKNRAIVNGAEADIYVQSLNLIIEYDGFYSHKDKFKQDVLKNKLFETYHFIRIRERRLSSIGDYGCVNFNMQNDTNAEYKRVIEFILKYIVSNCNLSESKVKEIKQFEIDIDNTQIAVWSNYLNEQESKSLVATHPNLTREWHPTKNGALTPNDVTYGSYKLVWWQCNKGHEWQAKVYNRKRCPYCKKLSKKQLQ